MKIGKPTTLDALARGKAADQVAIAAGSGSTMTTPDGA